MAQVVECVLLYSEPTLRPKVPPKKKSKGKKEFHTLKKIALKMKVKERCLLTNEQ
jgi:hypothetical protein